jgi:proteasome beta subunit
MTLVIALCCTDGVIMASDSQTTEAMGGVRWDVEKLFQLSDHAVMGGSGLHAALAEIRTGVESQREFLNSMESSRDLDQSLVTIIKPILEKHYDRFIRNVPARGPGPSPVTDVVAAGYTEERGPWILEIDRSCLCSYYEEHRGFHAVGSAAGFAQLAIALMRHFTVKERPIAHGRLVAYRTMRVAVDTAAQGVGGEIQMWEVTADGARRLSAEEVAEIETAVGGWEEAERNALDELMSGGEVEEEEPPMPDEVPGD